MLKFVAGELNHAILNNKESDDDGSSHDGAESDEYQQHKGIVELLSVNKQTYHSILSAPSLSKIIMSFLVHIRYDVLGDVSVFLDVKRI